jgi:dTDP-4-amino-4,6-dideoxygalactose transaminase
MSNPSQPGSSPSDARGSSRGADCDSSAQVPLLDLKLQYARIRPQVTRAIEGVLEGQQFILGANVGLLEDDIARYSGCAHAIGVSSGTDALLMALLALDIGPGDEVITSPYTFIATASVIERVGARPLFCDIDPMTYALAPGAVSQFIADRCVVRSGAIVNRETNGTVKALLPVHLFGHMADMQPLLELAKRYQLAVIEDAAQAIGAEYEGGQRAGSMGDIGCFSFFPSKNLGAYGDGGMCTTNDAALAERLRTLRVHGARARYQYELAGGNFRLDELQAAILRVKLPHLDEWTQARQRNAATYQRMLATPEVAPDVKTPRAAPQHRHVFNQYVIRARNRNRLRTWLSQAGIGTAVYYPLSLHRQARFGGLGYATDEFPESNRAAEETLALPIYPELTDDQLQYVADRIGGFYEANRIETGRA